jgi:hypothetical protein
MAPTIQGCIDELIKLVLLDKLPKVCPSNPKDPLCNPQFLQDLSQLPRCDVYRAPKNPRVLSPYQKHMSACMGGDPESKRDPMTFQVCKGKWKPDLAKGEVEDHMDHLYKGTGYTKE